MGKATIISESGNGKYIIELDIDARWIDRDIALLDTQLAQWPAIIAACDLEIADWQDNINQAVALQNTLNLPEDQEEWNDLQNDVNNFTREKEKKVQERSAANAKKTRATARKAELESYKTNYVDGVQVEAWCADFTEGLTGVVGTVEVPNERGLFAVQIRPGGVNPIWDSARDGQLQPAISGSASSFFYNCAMQPGKQKWRPQYRYGTIADLSWCDQTWEVNLKNHTSSNVGALQEVIDVDQSNVLDGDSTNVTYMTYGLYAFKVGDDVLVEFGGRDWQNPSIIGFKENPRSDSLALYLRPQINGTSLRYGGQQFSIEFTDTNGAEQTLGPLPIRGGTDTEKNQYCGPFDMSLWDRCNGVVIYLHAEKDMNDYADNSAISAWKTVNLPADSVTTDIDQMFRFYQEDSDGDYVYAVATQVFLDGTPGPSVPADCVRRINAVDPGGDAAENKFCEGVGFRRYAWVWPDMIPFNTWDTYADEWHFPYSDGEDPITVYKRKHIRNDNRRFNIVDKVKETFTATEFIALTENTETQIWNWDLNEFEENAIVVDYDFTGWSLPGTAMNRCRFAGYTTSRLVGYLTDDQAFSFLDDSDLMRIAWPNNHFVSHVNPAMYIEDSTNTYHIGPQNDIKLYSIELDANITDKTSLDPDEWDDGLKFTLDDGVGACGWYYYTISGDGFFTRDLLGMHQFNYWIPSTQGSGKRTGCVIGGHTWAGEKDWRNWAGNFPATADGVFRIISDNEIVSPGSITEISEQFVRDNHFAENKHAPSGPTLTQTFTDNTWTFSTANTVLPSIWF